MNCYTTLDYKSEVYARPFFEETDASAKRAFSIAVSDKSTLVGQAPEDFAVFRIGTFNDVNGILVSCEPVLVCRGNDLVVPPDDIVDQMGEFMKARSN